ncbi:glycyl aminopeptidase/ M61 family [Synechococcus sp. BIOS-E4-1]|uniref:M61 family metallopeptidase n=1 Tax=Synechococcus sp. BIOS-E4-1 TaxID=1400864 RepID=UPI00164811C0|nr:M61 family metallopeptidase [Synechococcus sp. BIOS-E4-1]QNI54761.1 glycyl aminopeptidase/ M61 family [Synechococcus sp. BIOS-E4-1]
MADVHVALDLRSPASQLLWVELQWSPAQPRQTWTLPVWTPGSYTVRDPSQHLHSLSVEQAGQPLVSRRRSPETWELQCRVSEPITLRYALEARQLTVRTNHLDPVFASLCLSAVVMLVEGQRWNRHLLQVLLPPSWSVVCPLPQDNGTFVAEDFDHLVDAPVHAGELHVETLNVREVSHQLVLIGTPPAGWSSTLPAEIEAICSSVCTLMDSDPPSREPYQLVLQLLDQGYGGLEHDNSSVMQFPWTRLLEEGGTRSLLQLIGHEYLHQWNVRRLRPSEYVPYRYDKPVISEGLWFAEGITSYFDLALTLLSGFSSRLDLLEDLAADLSHVLLNPGTGIQSLADSSREAWVRLYKQSPANARSQISYYKLGTALAFCLDVRLRQAGGSLARSLRLLWSRLGLHGRGYTRRDLMDVIGSTSPELASQLPTWLDNCGSIPIESCLKELGLELQPVMAAHPDAGWTLHENDGSVWIVRTVSSGAAESAGLVAGDELLAIRNWRCQNLQRSQQLLHGADQCQVFYSRRGRIASTELSLKKAGVERHRLAWDPGATREARLLRDQWFQII